MKAISSWLFLILLSISIPAWSIAYSAKEIEGWVVDAETKQPLEGVNVVARWHLNFGLDRRVDASLMLMEAVTDQSGRYYFPAWGPEPIPTELPEDARMRNIYPAIIFFRSGYAWRSEFNRSVGPDEDFELTLRTSDWNGKTVELTKFQGNLEQYASFTDGVLRGVRYGNCRWKKIPRMIIALTKEKERLKQKNTFSAVPTIRDIELSSVGQDCGSVQEFFKGYLK